MSNKPETISLPPRLPQNDEELNKVITLLGNRKRVELNARARHELERLIGVYPTAKEASAWKRVLRRVYQESIQHAETHTAVKESSDAVEPLRLSPSRRAYDAARRPPDDERSGSEK
jgi:hypothetical protein